MRIDEGILWWLGNVKRIENDMIVKKDNALQLLCGLAEEELD